MRWVIKRIFSILNVLRISKQLNPKLKHKTNILRLYLKKLKKDISPDQPKPKRKAAHKNYPHETIDNASMK